MTPDPATPPSLPQLPSSGGEFFDGVMRCVDPSLTLGNVQTAGESGPWTNLPGAMVNYKDIANRGMDALAASVDHFQHETSAYIQSFATAGDDAALANLEEQIGSA